MWHRLSSNRDSRSISFSPSVQVACQRVISSSAFRISLGSSFFTAASFASTSCSSASRWATTASKSAFSNSAITCPCVTRSPIFARSWATLPEILAPTRTSAPTCGCTAPVAKTDEEKSRR